MGGTFGGHIGTARECRRHGVVNFSDVVVQVTTRVSPASDEYFAVKQQVRRVIHAVLAYGASVGKHTAGGIVKFRATSVDDPVLSAHEKHQPVINKGCDRLLTGFTHLACGGEFLRGRIVKLGFGEEPAAAAPAAGDQHLPVGQQCCGLVLTR